MTHRFYISPKELNLNDETAVISGAEYDHASKALRLGVGDEIELFDGRGNIFDAKIASAEKKMYHVDIKEKFKEDLDYSLAVYIGLPKGRKMDVIVNMLTQAGATLIGTYKSKYTEAKGGAEKAQRLNKIAVEACKQSKRSWLPKISPGLEFDDMLREIKGAKKTVVFYENADSYIEREQFKSDELALIIGPEGGFAQEEIESLKGGNVIISRLSDAILRVETAALAATQLGRYAQLA